MKNSKMLTILVMAMVVPACVERSALAGEVVAWGSNFSGQCNVSLPNEGFVALAAGNGFSLGLKADGSIAGWGYNVQGQIYAPSPNKDFVAVGAGASHSLGVKADGSIVAWGDNGYGQCNVPSPNEGFVAVAGGEGHSLGLKSDGSVVAWGWNDGGQCNVPSPNADFIAVSAGMLHSLGLKSDGSIATWGVNAHNQCVVPSPNEGFIGIAAGGYHSLGLKSDGSIVAWGMNFRGQCNVPWPNEDFVAVSAGREYSLGLKADGTIIAWGYNAQGQCNVPSPNDDFVAIAAGGFYGMGLRRGTMGTAFTYQGYLKDTNSSADGLYDFQFSLYDGENVHQGDTISIDDLDLVDGYFTVKLDFGSDVFDGYARRLEVTVRPGASNDPNDFVSLSPRQKIMPSPYSLQTRGLFIDNSSNVGIGTTNPRRRLDISGKNSIGPAILSISANYGRGNQWGAGTPIGAIEFWNDDEGWNDGDGKVTAKIQQTIYDDYGNTRLDIFTNIADGDAMPGIPSLSIKEDKVGVGTINPLQKFDVAGNAAISGNAAIYGTVGIGTQTTGFPLTFANAVGNKISLCGQSGAHYGLGIQSSLLQIYSEAWSTDIAFGYGSSDSFTEKVRFKGNGYVGIGTTSPISKLHVDGGCITGSMCSDIRLKKNIEPLPLDDSILDRVMGLQAVTFEWKHRDDGKRQIGLIAQDVEDVFPEVVTTPDDDSCEKGLLATGLDAVLVEAIKELKAENEQLKERLEALERTMKKPAKAKE